MLIMAQRPIQSDDSLSDSSTHHDDWDAAASCSTSWTDTPKARAEEKLSQMARAFKEAESRKRKSLEKPWYLHVRASTSGSSEVNPVRSGQSSPTVLSRESLHYRHSSRSALSREPPRKEELAVNRSKHMDIFHRARSLDAKRPPLCTPEVSEQPSLQSMHRSGSKSLPREIECHQGQRPQEAEVRQGHHQSPLLGYWKLQESENWDNFLKEAGVGVVVRKLSRDMTTYEQIVVSRHHWTIRMLSFLKNFETTFRLNEEFEEENFDGKRVKAIATFNPTGDILTIQQTPLEADGLAFCIVREHLPDDRMRLTVTCKNSGVWAKRYFVRSAEESVL